MPQGNGWIFALLNDASLGPSIVICSSEHWQSEEQEMWDIPDDINRILVDEGFSHTSDDLYAAPDGLSLRGAGVRASNLGFKYDASFQEHIDFLYGD